MGCDIHCYKEKHVDGQWVTADEWEACDYGYNNGMEVSWEKRFTNRNYKLFGLLANGVRSKHTVSFKPRGLPFNLCPEIAAEVEGWGNDGHSHSYLYLHELKDMLAYLETAPIQISGMKHKDELNFKLYVPAPFYMGNDLKEIIDSFDGVDGDNHRIVFFFDN